MRQNTAIARRTRYIEQHLKCGRQAIYFLIGLVLIVIASIYSAGPQHPDEYFQIIEFASYKLGITPAQELPYEFSLKIRPWFQPFVAALPMAVAESFGFTRTTGYGFIRLFFGISFYLSVIFFLKIAPLAERARELARKYYLAVCFVPFLAVRTSSESFCFTMCLLALGFVGRFQQRQTLRNAMLVGLCFGLSFLARMQAAAFFFGFIAWALAGGGIDRKEKFKVIGGSFFGFASACGLGVILDRLGYSEWVYTPGRYFLYNIVAGKAQEFGSEPFYFFFQTFLSDPVLQPLQIPLFAATIWFLVRNPCHILTWLWLAFFIGNSLPAHKETRFVFPLFLFMPFFLFAMLASLNNPGTWIRIAILCFAILNIATLGKRIFDAPLPQVEAIAAIDNTQNEHVCYENMADPYRYTNLHMFYLRSKKFVESCHERPLLTTADHGNCRLVYSQPWWTRFIDDARIPFIQRRQTQWICLR